MSDDFKIISGGKALSYPNLRLFAALLACVLFGIVTGIMIAYRFHAFQ